MNTGYFDHAATTRPHASVVAALLETLDTQFANPSSLHRAGLRAERIVEEARVILAEALGCEPEETVFTSGGTEANYLALAGTLRPGDRVLTTPLEHSSIRAALEALGRQGVVFEELSLGPDGTVDARALQDALQAPCRLLSVQHVNNETGIIQPVAELCRLAKRIRPQILVHSDGIQAFGKFSAPLRGTPLDLYSVSAHKIGGPKGTGALFVRKNTPLVPVMPGGGQESGRRGGTQNVPGIAGFRAATEEWERNREEWTQHAKHLRARLLDGLAEVEDFSVQSPEGGSPFILSLGFADARGEVLLHMLEQKELYISTGSACAKGAVSRVLQKLGVQDTYAQGTVRVSFGPENTTDDVDLLIKELKAAVALIRNMTRRRR